MADVESYVRAVTGTMPRKHATDVAHLLYHYSYKISTLVDMLKCPQNAYQHKIALEQLMRMQTDLLIQAKHCEDIQLTLF